MSPFATKLSLATKMPLVAVVVVGVELDQGTFMGRENGRGRGRESGHVTRESGQHVKSDAFREDDVINLIFGLNGVCFETKSKYIFLFISNDWIYFKIKLKFSKILVSVAALCRAYFSWSTGYEDVGNRWT
jgi:hypothetical protein